jgi:hypothetical protein
MFSFWPNEKRKKDVEENCAYMLLLSYEIEKGERSRRGEGTKIIMKLKMIK